MNPNSPLPSYPAPATPVAGRFVAITPLASHGALRQRITQAWRKPEPQAVADLLEEARLPPAVAARAQALATHIVQALRTRRSASGKAGLVQGLLQEFSLSSQEGVALMCLAEALLRIPDGATRDALIRDKISHGDWRGHVGQSPSVFVNAAAWGLMLTGKLVATHSEQGLAGSLGRLIARGGEPLIRKGVDMAMRLMGEQFVTGETMAQALAHAQSLEAQGFRYSYDMLGEAALTAADAQRYNQDYENAIHAIGQAANGRGVYEGPGISIKLSALHPRYCRAQYARVMDELYPRVLHLAQLARSYDIGLNIDAEEADRLELSLDLLERLCFEPSLQDWQGIGFVIQAYQKRCPAVIDYLIDLARRSGHRLMIRLVKGAYWDSEIKRAQVDGMPDYPVYTRKPYTDLSYIACARRLLAAPEAVYPQFATHNAQSLAAIHELAGPASYQPGQYEFQCLHGMGEPLYEQVVGPGKLGRPCRIYAPVGTHETLLAYLVRRLLENGANTSFVNRIADPDVAIADLVRDPVDQVENDARREGALGLPHPGIAAPRHLYGPQRLNAWGLDLANDQQLAALTRALQAGSDVALAAVPLLAEGIDAQPNAVAQPVPNPSDHRDTVGTVREASPAEVDAALQAAHAEAPQWAATPPTARAQMLRQAAEALEADLPALLGTLVREAGKTYANAMAEVREAVDFLRYYAAQAQAGFDTATHRPLGPVLCISPWNFPLAIFTGQIAAALAAGNTVLAKPAEQTPLIATLAVQHLHRAGVPRAALQLLPGRGETVGARLTGDARIQGVMFTGSTEVARLLQKTLARRLGPEGKPIPLIAETGGQNAMIVDSSALTEQVVGDVVSSAFDSAGQRCSALRVLCVQEDVADRVIEMLKGAMAELALGNPEWLAHDIGPVIDAEARDGIDRHIDRLRTQGRTVHQAGRTGSPAALAHGTFVPPTLIVLESLAELEREVFGPVLHVVRYPRSQLPRLLDEIRDTGYGLTLGLHTRIDETIAQVVEAAHAGNVYVNRNIVGAVVGVQPFGGEGLSGTGPKAGGPLYLYRLLASRPAEALDRPFGTRPPATAIASASASASAPAPVPRTPSPASQALAAWTGKPTTADDLAFGFLTAGPFELPGPTGECNTYRVLPRNAVLCLARRDDDRLAQLAAVLAVGSRPVWPTDDARARALHARLPPAVQAAILWDDDRKQASVDAVLHQGDETSLRRTLERVARWPGPIVGVTALPEGDSGIPLERLVVERALSVNTAAAGGNASLMTMA